MKDKIYCFGAFNNWKGCIGLFFTKKELRQIAKEVGIKAKDIEEYDIADVYKLYKV